MGDPLEQEREESQKGNWKYGEARGVASSGPNRAGLGGSRLQEWAYRVGTLHSLASDRSTLGTPQSLEPPLSKDPGGVNDARRRFGGDQGSGGPGSQCTPLGAPPQGCPQIHGQLLHGQGGTGLALPGMHMEVSSPPIGCRSPWGSTAAPSSLAAPPRSEPLPPSTVPPFSPSCSPARRAVTSHPVGERRGGGVSRPRPIRSLERETTPTSAREEGRGGHGWLSGRERAARNKPALGPSGLPGAQWSREGGSPLPFIYPTIPADPGIQAPLQASRCIRLSPTLGACRDLNAFFFCSFWVTPGCPQGFLLAPVLRDDSYWCLQTLCGVRD